MNPFANLLELIRYLLGKKSELLELDVRDVVMEGHRDKLVQLR